MSSPTEPRPASLLRRLGAILYDTLLLFAVLFIGTALVLPLTGGTAVPAGHPLFSLYILVICFLFYAWFWTHGGQTLGMRAWKLRLQKHTGEAITWAQALLRFGLVALCLLPVVYARQVLGLHWGLSLIVGSCFLGFVLALRLHDRYSETVLVRLPPKPKTKPKS